jgi:AraC-like DNA-binding protein/mannose-6-phosphate isomerase-like protein (cupin superfamily)
MKYFEYNEGKKHGTAEFPIEYYYIDSSHPQYEMPPHWHGEFEIIRVISGGFNVYLNNEEFVLSEGSILLVPPGVLHRGIPNCAIYECIVFDINMLKRRKSEQINDFITPIAKSEVTIICHVPDDDIDIYVCIDALFDQIKEKDAHYELSVYGTLFLLFGKLYKNGYIKKSKVHALYSKKISAVIKLLSYIEEHFVEQITLDSLAAVAGKDKKYVCRIFKEYTSKSPIDYTNELRVSFAKRLLCDRSNSITEIAYESGFNDSGYFSKIFKQYIGMTPREFKNSQMK